MGSNDHPRDVDTVLERLIEANMQLNPSKCSFFQNELLYLGHIISADGIKPENKIKGILNIQIPTDII